MAGIGVDGTQRRADHLIVQRPDPRARCRGALGSQPGPQGVDEQQVDEPVDDDAGPEPELSASATRSPAVTASGLSAMVAAGRWIISGKPCSSGVVLAATSHQVGPFLQTAAHAGVRRVA
jgi:hypothetical protein